MAKRTNPNPSDPTPAKPRSRKPRPSFDVPPAADTGHVGWVYRSDETQPRPAEAEVRPAAMTVLPAEEEERPETGDSVDAIVKTHAMYAAGAGLVPVPLFDMAAIGAVQVRMVMALAAHYGVAMDREWGKTAVPNSQRPIPN